ncbi:MAG: hypothetical protein IIC89_02555 [Chloroflexi bacterium]|nr:hypothetical protein [Chloroflexota bacterium]
MNAPVKNFFSSVLFLAPLPEIREILEEYLDQDGYEIKEIDESTDDADQDEALTEEEALEAERQKAIDASMLGKDWRGMAPAMSGRMLKLLLRSKPSFEKFWGRISNEDPPEIEFKKFMVIGIVAGSRERANGIEIEEVRTRTVPAREHANVRCCRAKVVRTRVRRQWFAR